MKSWKLEPGVKFSHTPPELHPDSWIESPTVVQATLAPKNLIQIGAFSGIYGGRLGHCRIGRYCSLAPGIDVASDQHPSDWLSTSMMQYVPNLHGWGDWMRSKGLSYPAPTESFRSNAQVTIGNDVWIGQGAFIKSGVNIGDGVIVAAHSVVAKDIPPYCIVAGVPAKIIRMRFSARTIERLLALAWWDYEIFSIQGIRYSDIENTLAKLEDAKASAQLKKLPIERFSFIKGDL